MEVLVDARVQLLVLKDEAIVVLKADHKCDSGPCSRRTHVLPDDNLIDMNHVSPDTWLLPVRIHEANSCLWEALCVMVRLAPSKTVNSMVALVTPKSLVRRVFGVAR